jgi:hypothetical protein
MLDSDQKDRFFGLFWRTGRDAGAPALLDGVRVARKVWAEHEAKSK